MNKDREKNGRMKKTMEKSQRKKRKGKQLDKKRGKNSNPIKLLISLRVGAETSSTGGGEKHIETYLKHQTPRSPETPQRQKTRQKEKQRTI